MKVEGFIETTLSIVIVLACFAAGFIFAYKTKVIDSPAEQMVEGVLESQGIDVDFSADKKAAQISNDMN